MSGRSIGPLAGGIIGGVIGSVVPGIGTGLGVAVGSALGGVAGSFFDYSTTADQFLEQPSITDLKLQTSTYGRVISQVFGTFSVAGNVIWAQDKVEHEDREYHSAGGSGGGPTQVTITKTYTISWAIAICDTRLTGPLTHLRRVWRDTTLIFGEAVNGAIVPESVTITDGGSGYSLADTGTVVGGDGRATYQVVSETGGVVDEILITDGGYGYSTGGAATVAGGVQPGAGSGLTIQIDETLDAGFPEGWTFYSGTSTQGPDPLIESFEGTGNVPGYHYTCYVVIEDDNLGQSGRTHNYTFEVSFDATTTSKPLPTVIEELCEPCGLISGETLDLTDLSPTGLAEGDVSLALVTIQAVRAPMEQLAQVFRFYGVESGTTLKIRSRGAGDIVATIPESDLGVGDEQHTETTLEVTRLHELELPRQLSVTYLDSFQDYQENTQRAQLDLPTDAIDTPRNINTTLAIFPETAKQLAEELLAEAWIQREVFRFVLSWKYAYLEPGDRIVVTARSIEYGLVLTETSLGRPGILECQARVDAAYVRNMSVQEDAVAVVEFPTQSVYRVGDTTPLLLNIPALDANDTTTHYSVAYIGANDSWAGAVLYRSVDGGTTYQQEDVGPLEGITGTVALAMADADWHVLDTTTSVSVVLEYGTLQSISDLALYNGGNLVLIGDEICAFGVATLTAPRTYTLTRWLRGRRGTEWAVGGHGTNESFVVLDAGVRRVPMTLADRYVERQFKAVSLGQAISDAAEVDFTPTAASLHPWSVAQPDAELSGPHWVLTWRYRARYNGDWVDGSGTGFDMDFLAFRIIVYDDNTYITAVRTIDTDGGNPMDADAEKTYTYDSTMQTADFGSPQATLYYRIYQMNVNGLSVADDLVGV